MQTPCKLRKTLKLITNEPHTYHPPCKFLKPECNAEMCYRAATVDFWQARTPQRRSLHWRATTSATVFSMSQNPAKDQALAALSPVVALCYVFTQKLSTALCHHKWTNGTLVLISVTKVLNFLALNAPQIMQDALMPCVCFKTQESMATKSY